MRRDEEASQRRGRGVAAAAAAAAAHSLISRWALLKPHWRCGWPGSEIRDQMDHRRHSSLGLWRPLPLLLLLLVVLLVLVLSLVHWLS